MGVLVATPAQRALLATAMDFLVAHAGRVRWAEARPIPRVPSLAALEKLVVTKGLVTDCSGSSILTNQVAGLLSPTGRYDGQGDTQTIYDHLTIHYENPAKAGVGAFCWFGIDGDLESQHITRVRHPGPDPILFSLGHNPGPNYYPLSVERKAHTGSVVFLSIAHL